MSLEERVIRRLNQELGSDIENLHKSKDLVEKFNIDLDNIEIKLTLENPECSTILKKALETTKESIKKLNSTLKSTDKYQKTIQEKINVSNTITENLRDHLYKIKELEHYLEYFRVVQDIQDISNELVSCIHSRDELKIVNLYLALCGDPNSSTSVLGRLQDVNAPNLKLYARQIALYWHEIIKEKLSKEFEIVLKNIKWPNLGQVQEVFSPSKDSINKLTSFAEYMFLVQLPGYDRFMYVKITPSIICPPISTPIELLVKPFKQRFDYHFMGVRQTNRIDKPEWYFTQILNWAKENHIFVGEIFQSAANRACITENTRLEFVRGLVQLTIEKLVLDIEEICMNDQLFGHLIDEILSFEQDLKTMLSYPNTLPSAVCVLTQPFYFTRWLSIEEKFITDKMDQILSAENDPWELLDPLGFNCITTSNSTMAIDNNLEMEELKIPKCADQFIRLLDAIKERYCSLPQPTHQLRFLDLQLKLIEDFRYRLVQLHNSSVTAVNTTKILNALFYITSVLREWGENVHYLHLHAALLGPNAEEITSVFDKSVVEMEHWQNRLVKMLAAKVVNDIKAKSMTYRHDNWVTMLEQNSREPFILSYSAGEMFQLLVTNLHELENELSTKLFNSCLRYIANSLDDFFIDSMIMNIKFSNGGASQFKFDMIRNLVPLFGQYSRRPGHLFKNISDACTLLTLPFGTALLLQQTLKPSSRSTETDVHKKLKDALKEVGVTSLPINMALDILQRRTDIPLQ